MIDNSYPTAIRQPRREHNTIRPVDLTEALQRLRLGIGPAARMCGVSIRQLSYWTDKGVFSDAEEKESQSGKRKRAKKSSSRSRVYDFPAIEKACLIKQGLDKGYSLEAAVNEAEAFLHRKKEEASKLQQLSENELSARLNSEAQGLSELAERIRRGLRTYRVSGDLGRMAASSQGLEGLITFFEANPFTVNTARQIALRLGRNVEGVTEDLKILEEKRFIQRISYPGNDIYRYLPRRR